MYAVSCGGGDGTTPDGDPQLNKGNVGASANDLLSSSSYTSLTVQIQYMPGFRPPESSISFLENFLNDRLNKIGGITVNLEEISGGGQNAYSLTELRSIEDNQRTAFTSGNRIAAYFLFVDGDYSANANVLGVAHRNTSMVLFQKRIEELSGGIGQASTELLTSSVITHEFAHILGLVNVGSPMQTNHQDEANGAHCNVESCLMYFAVESSAGLDDLIGASAPPSLDSQCLEDLRANGGK